MKERQAVTRLKQDDIGGLETLVRQYQVRAVHAAYLITRDRPLAEDIVQSAFLRAYERISQFDDARPFGPWFLRSVINDATKAVVRRERQVSLDCAVNSNAEGTVDRLADPGETPLELLERAETYEAIREALTHLSLTQRTAIVQRYYLGMSESEMAAQMARPPGTIKSRLSAARAQLRRRLSPLWLTAIEAEAPSDRQE